MTERKVAGRYRLLEPIGEGGMGVVWRAHDELLDRVVAVKEVRYRGVDEAERADLNRRTIREARTAGRLDHPSVIIVHDVVEEEGRPWIVMQMVRSRSLGQVVRENGPLAPERVASVGLQVLGALLAAHAAGVLHRDVKPENVLLAHDGRVVLTDFGIASMAQETGITRTGGMVGTPAFLPPERLHGLAATPESDLWSLGATLYAALEGRPPFERATAAATMMAVLHGEPAPLTHTGPLADAVLGLMAKDPATRMTAEHATALLGRAAAGGSPGHRNLAGAGSPPAPAARHFQSSSPEDAARPGGSPYDARWPRTGQHSPQAGLWHAGHAGQQPPTVEPVGPPHLGGPTHTGQPYPDPVRPPHLGGPTHIGQPSSGPARPEQWPDRGRPTDAGRSAPRVRRPGAGRVALATGAPLLAVAVGVGAWLVLRDQGDPAAASPAATVAVPGETTVPTAPSKTPRATATSSPAIPRGWQLHRDPMGFTVAVPRGWAVKRFSDRDRVEFRPPGRNGFLWIESTEDPETDPVRHWEKVERGGLAKKIWPGYERIGITPLRYRGLPAADWEFTYLKDKVRVRVLDRGFRTSAGRPYAIYWEGPDDSRSQRVFFDTFTETFRP
ncbi:serine/threonine protein kinase [Streptosporangium album]|uniref:non-specific serine/threonine protein kinase n=1 Tax=Streptosporangium album TaxID=47479 RepID=A0A7W7S054_9ACTN|nr:serine/threonine-protein kinase [Streptosporangium album]MBB4941470.1 serine/threonine protein kinase [Streptosporangium album]